VEALESGGQAIDALVEQRQLLLSQIEALSAESNANLMNLDDLLTEKHQESLGALAERHREALLREKERLEALVREKERLEREKEEAEARRRDEREADRARHEAEISRILERHRQDLASEREAHARDTDMSLARLNQALAVTRAELSRTESSLAQSQAAIEEQQRRLTESEREKGRLQGTLGQGEEALLRERRERAVEAGLADQAVRRLSAQVKSLERELDSFRSLREREEKEKAEMALSLNALRDALEGHKEREAKLRYILWVSFIYIYIYIYR
jgi:chromosome segregation ATPase